ncbi:hypothetical protein P8C59_001368 [Phyllachora maydis]|uniref:Uncharacterized protein n=1 Tax=Phyllachora maydis TaxID=1825666 RepID=A0AAD9M905_9PEZI|nr:hypothetical protein P8C59_001368 [Phyllachora maydis]
MVSKRAHDVVDLTLSNQTWVRFWNHTKIVGVRYYDGYAVAGEIVICKREPSNPYDSNAIRVDNCYRQQIGHIPRNVAAKLAAYLDTGEIMIEARLTGEKGLYDCPMRVYIYGTSDPLARADLETRLKSDRLVTATQLKNTRKQIEAVRIPTGLKSGRSTAGIAKNEPPPSVEALAMASQTVQVQARADYVKSLAAMDEHQLSKMPLAQQPSKLRATLLPYQLQGLAWLTAKETPTLPAADSDDISQLWKRDGSNRYKNVATSFTTKDAPTLLSGGILADDMGLGKTLQVISLLMTGGAGSTLIVAPVSVMSNWEQQIRRHVLDEHVPKVHIHHGSARASMTKDLQEFDVVITSYGTMASDTGGPLFQKEWRRVVLDEGHQIRNAHTKAAEAACLLKAKSRWVLTGTPIINNIRDLHSLLKFLRITGGIEQSEVFNAVLARPLADGEARAETILQALMRDLCLRRKKDMKFVDLKLPAKTEYKHAIEFWPDEKQKYEAMLMEAKDTLAKFEKKKSTHHKNQFQGVLERLLRLRQICNHWALCKDRVDEVIKFLEVQGVMPLSDKNKKMLQRALRLMMENQDECSVCYEVMTGPVITHCKHAFDRHCLTEWIERQHNCPLCRSALDDSKLIEPAPEGEQLGEQDDEQPKDLTRKSSKTEALLNIVSASLRKEGSKVIIFSQWTSFLDLVQHQINEAGHRFVRIDGSMNAGKRDASIRALDTDPGVRVMLASLAVASVGLNLVAADTVILSDSWWAPAIEDQAIDRVHRLGQTRPTTVWRLVMEGTIEERVLDIQTEKRQLVTKAFKEKSGQKKAHKETRLADVQKLLS